jgi:hypothetical protein
VNLDEADLYMKAFEYLVECFEARRPQERVRVEDDGAPNAANMNLAAALAKGIQDARANAPAELDKLFVDTPELAREIAKDPFEAGADAVMYKYGIGPDGDTIPKSALVADKAECQAVVDAVMAAPPKYDSSKMSIVEFAAATESHNRNKYHETLAKTAAAKISLIDALIGHSGAALALSRAEEGPRRVELAACVARAAAEVARARAYAADVELFIICNDVAVLRDKLVTGAMRDSSTLKRGQLKARRTVLHRELRKRVLAWRRVRGRARASRVLRPARVSCPSFLPSTVVEFRACQVCQSVRRSCSRLCVYCLIPVRAVVSRSSNVLALLGGLHQHHRLLAFARSSTVYTVPSCPSSRRCVCVLSLISSLPAAPLLRPSPRCGASWRLPNTPFRVVSRARLHPPSEA